MLMGDLEGMAARMAPEIGVTEWISQVLSDDKFRYIKELKEAGYDINADCGSTHPEQLQSYVRSVGADMGVAYDGDADRCLAVDIEDRKSVV